MLYACVAPYQYIHSIATNLVYYLHVPGEPLRDLGFELIPELEEGNQFWSEVCFLILVVIIIVFIGMPFFCKERPGEQRFVILMVARYARALMICQTIRMVSFLVTILPSPSYHCRLESPEYDPPQDAAEIFLRLDIFSGTLVRLLFVRVYNLACQPLI